MFTIDKKLGYLAQAQRVPSPNCDERPQDQVAELIVIHCISLPPGEFQGPWIDDLFQNKLDPSAHPYFAQIDHLKVSAHALIGRAGRVNQYVPFHQRAWHAGESEFEGRRACNDFSIGIELEGTDDTPFRSIQYWKLAQLICALRATYPALVSCANVGHSDIARGRKTDPGDKFEWPRLHRLIEMLQQRSTII